MLISKTLLPNMKANKFGKINICSIWSLITKSNRSLYTMINLINLNGLTKTISLEGAKFNILD